MNPISAGLSAEEDHGRTSEEEEGVGEPNYDRQVRNGIRRQMEAGKTKPALLYLLMFYPFTAGRLTVVPVEMYRCKLSRLAYSKIQTSLYSGEMDPTLPVATKMWHTFPIFLLHIKDNTINRRRKKWEKQRGPERFGLSPGAVNGGVFYLEEMRISVPHRGKNSTDKVQRAMLVNP